MLLLPASEGELGGGDIEPVLQSSSVVLLDARWLVARAEQKGRLLPRQAMPSEAFVSMSQVQAATADNELRIICTSHCWLQPDHPDPLGHNVGILAHAADILGKQFGRWAIFLDFASINQCCRDWHRFVAARPDRGERSREELDLRVGICRGPEFAWRQLGSNASRQLGALQGPRIRLEATWRQYFFESSVGWVDPARIR